MFLKVYYFRFYKLDKCIPGGLYKISNISYCEKTSPGALIKNLFQQQDREFA